MIFVFGSNLAGVHGAGAAAYALKTQGAVWGKGVGLHGNSYGIPTKDHSIRTLPFNMVKNYIDDFIKHAVRTPQTTYKVTRIGCGLAGFTDEQIAPLFKDAPDNCYFDSAWDQLLPNRNYWGSI